MSLRTTLPLACLNEAELASVHGSCPDFTPELTLNLVASPLRGSVGVTLQNDQNAISGKLSTNGTDWNLGLAWGFHPNNRIDLEGFAQTNGQNHEFGIKGRIRFLRA